MMEEVYVARVDKTLFTSLTEWMTFGTTSAGVFLAVVILFSTNIDDFFIFISFLLVGGVSLYLDIIRMRVNRNNMTERRFWYRTTRYMGVFLSGGYLAGMLWVYLSRIFSMMVISWVAFPQTFANDEISDPYVTELLTLAILVFSVLIGLSFYRILVENSFSGSRVQLFSGGHEIAFLIQFFLMAAYLPLILMTVAFGTLKSEDFESNFVAASLGQVVYPLFFIPLTLLITLVVVDIVPKILDHSQYRYPRLEHRGMIAGQFLVSVFLIFFSVNMFRFSRSNSFIIFIVVLLLEGMVIYQVLSGLKRELCSTCQLVKSTTDSGSICISCEGEMPDIKVPKLLESKAKVPQCPSCKEEWSSFSRQCSNCNYLYLLSCPHCAQTINPLWTVCVSCKNDLIPIPKIALEAGSSTSFSKSAVLSVVFGAVLLLNLIFEILTIITVNSLTGEDRTQHWIFFISAVYRSIVYGIALLLLIYLMLNFSKQYFTPVILLVIKLVLSGISLITLYVFPFLVFRVIDMVMPVIPLIFGLPLLLLALAMWVYFWRREWINLLEFRPTVGYDPFFDNISEVDTNE